MNELWLNDIKLNKLKDDLDKYKIISFDIFDTLLFRTVDQPKDIFEIVYDNFKKNIHQECFLIKEEFMEMRILSENNARAKKKNVLENDMDVEVTLEEIYEEFKCLLEYKEELIKIEIETEKENLFLNPVIYSLIKYVKKKSKNVILVSDMYLDKNTIESFLINAGVDVKLIDNIFVSSEFKKSKSSGKLFKEVLNYYGISSKDILHIGDNEISDIEGAYTNGINSCHYNSICKKNFDIDLEKMKFDITPSKLNSLRKISGNICISENENEKFWFELGTKVIGPFLTLFSQWSIDLAKKKKISQIFPLMREGVILTQTLKQAAKYNNINLKIEPLYVSRESTLLPSITCINEQFLKEFFLKRHLTVEDMMRNLNILDSVKDKEIFIKLEKSQTTQLNEDDEENIIQLVMNNKKVIEEEIVSRRKAIILYLKEQIDFSKEFLTLDLGYRGNIQRSLDKILKNYGDDIKALHLLAIGSEELYKNLIDGTKVITYANYLSSNLRLSEASIIEELMNDERGSTIGYKINNNTSKPVLADNVKPKEEFFYKRACQNGILFFQKLFYEVLYPRFNEEDYLKYSEEAMVCLARLLEMPTVEEAKNLINLHHDENNGTNYVNTFLSDNDKKLVKKNDYETFMRLSKSEKVMWPQGVATLNYTNEYFVKNISLFNNNIKYFNECVNTAVRLVENGIEKVIIYGAGEVCKTLVQVFDIYKIKTEFIIDKRESLEGKSIDSIPIVHCNNVSNKKHYSNTVVIASFSFLQEIRNKINEIFDDMNIIEVN